jgi:amidohydrolase
MSYTISSGGTLMNKQLLSQLQARISQILPEIKDLRRNIHSEPELGLDTTGTAYKIREALQETSLAFFEPFLGGDVVAELEGQSTRTICLRADIDALPIHEETGLPYASIFAGRMHACGHDGHAAMLVGAIRVLDSVKEHLPVSVRFVFQPGEEVIGAGKELVKRGAVNGCEAAYAIHGWPGLPAGCVSTLAGPMMAAAAMFVIEIKGKGCHGARPEDGKNPIPTAARIVSALAAMHERWNSQNGSIISVCSFQSGTNSNVIPDAAIIRGTTRYLSNEVGDSIQDEIRKAVAEICRDAGTEARIEYEPPYDLPVINTESGYRLVRSLAEEYLPAGSWREMDKPSMGAEDFAYYLPGREGAMFHLGLGESSPGIHTCSFDFNDDVLGTGILMHCLLALAH